MCQYILLNLYLYYFNAHLASGLTYTIFHLTILTMENLLNEQ